MRVIEHLNGLSGEVVESPYLELLIELLNLVLGKPVVADSASNRGGRLRSLPTSMIL